MYIDRIHLCHRQLSSTKNSDKWRPLSTDLFIWADVSVCVVVVTFYEKKKLLTNGPRLSRRKFG